MKRVWRDLSKGKKIAGLVVLCMAVILGYFGIHQLVARADQFVRRGVINDIATLPKGNMNTADEGSDENPFLFLEIVPSVDQASLGYMIDGGEPIAFDMSDSTQVREKYGNVGYIVTKVFDDEYEHFYGTDEEKKDAFPGGDSVWKHENTQSVGLYGYYEKVGTGEGNFVQDVNVQDTLGLFGDGTYYVPGFREVEFGQGDYVWVSCCEPGFEDWMKAQSYDKNAKKDSKRSTDPNASFTLKEGDRQYAYREGTTHYYGDMSHIHGVHRHDFLRTALGPNAGCYTRKEMKNFNVLVKTIEPKELSEHPEWIDYADVIFMSRSGSSVANYWKSYASQRRITDTGTASADNFGKNGQDFTWEVARKLFMKVNALEEYDGYGDFRFAPMLLDYNVVGHIYGSNAPGDTYTWFLDYVDMKSDTSREHAADGGWNSNIWKFLVMDCTMKQETFYDLFWKAKMRDGKPVIRTKNDAGQVGLCQAQDNDNGKEYWTYYTFWPSIPRTEPQYSEMIEYFDLKPGFDFGYGTGQENVGLNGATFMFNADNLVAQLSNTGVVKRNKATQDAFDWFQDEEDTNMGDGMGLQDMLHYLLNYKKKGGGDDDERDRDKTLVRILEIEPCNEFIWKAKDGTLSSAAVVFFPSSRFEVEVDCMTSQHFNGAKTDLVSDYDIVYMGLTKGKFNTEEADLELNKTDYVTYNDANFKANDLKLAGKIYLHVGDLVKAASDKQLRFSGNDFSALKRVEVKDFTSSGGVLILDDILKNFKSKKYTRTVDSSANVTTLLNSVASKSNVESYEALKSQYSKLQEMLINSKAAFKSQMEIVDTPPKYAKATASTAASGSALQQVGSEGTFQMLNSSVLNFTFRINKADFDKKFGTTVDEELNKAEYGIRLYMDINYDGQISDNEEQSELVYDSVTDAEKYGMPSTYKAREKEYTFSFDFVKEVYEARKLAYRKNGAVTWKFVIYDTANENYCVTESGISWYQGSNEKASIRFYQVVDNDAKGSKVDLKSQSDSSGSLFYKWTHDLADYKISADSETVTLNEYIQKYNTEILTAGSDEDKIAVFQDYDMFIVSCSDAMLAQAAPGAVDFISDLANSGFSVLYTKSTVSRKESADAAQNIRNMLNQSRFTDAYAAYTDKASYSSGVATTSNKLATTSNYKSADYESLEYTYAAVMQDGKKASNDKKAFNNSLWSGVTYEANDNALKTKTITQLNQGKLSVFPYVIDETLNNIVDTKAQDFQLNMNNSEMTVWYCLGGEDDTTYGISPNDATNNYYLYTVGNVAYTAADLKNMTDDMEMKLFVNTLIGNYEVGYIYPHVTVNAMKGIGTANKDGEVKESSSYTNTESILYFDGILGEMQKQYLDYVPKATPIVVPPTPTPEVSLEPAETMEPDEPEESTDPGVSEEIPTPEPEKEPDPIEVPIQSGQTSVTYGNTAEEKAAIAALGDDAILVVQYHSDNQWANGTAIWGMNVDNWVAVPWTPSYGTNAAEVQTATMRVADIRSILGQTPFSYMSISGNYDIVYDYVGFFHNQKQLDDFLNPSTSGGSGDSTDENDSKITWDPKKVTEVAETDDNSYIPTGKDYTHKVYFTPFDNNVPGGNIHSLRISMIEKAASGKPEEDVVYEMVKNIYHQDATGHIFQFTASADGTFTVNKRNFTQDSREYFFLYKEKYILSNYNYVKFEIENIKRKGITYFYPHTEAKGDNTYVFPLD